MNTCRPMPDATCEGPHTMSDAGVAAKIMPCLVGFSAGESTSTMGLVPLLAMDPMAFSTMLARPPFLLPGVGLASRSTPPSARYSSYHFISAASLSRTAALTQRAASMGTPSRTSVTSLNSTVAPPFTSISAA